MEQTTVQLILATIMSFAFRGSRPDIESGFPGYIHERPAVVCVDNY